jgi:uncharacterized protein YjbJ (UPF0337 family)
MNNPIKKPVKKQKTKLIPDKYNDQILELLAENYSGLDIHKVVNEVWGIKCSQDAVYARIKKLNAEKRAITDAARYAAASRQMMSEIERSNKAVSMLWNQFEKSLAKGKVNEARMLIETMTKVQEKLGHFSSLGEKDHSLEGAKQEMISEVMSLIETTKDKE